MLQGEVILLRLETNRRRSVLQCRAAVSTAGPEQLLQRDFALTGC